jgi:CYTH domain-containing protein
MSTIPIEIERKYIIKKPCHEKLSALEGYSKSEILQIYLASAPGITHRIRMRRCDESVTYTETVKRRIDRISAYEDEHEISEGRFHELEKLQRQGTRAVHKNRYTFCYSGKTFEIDEYPRWRKTCLMEIELDSRDEEIHLPPYIEVIKEVTGNKSYSNASMSRAFPRECGQKK